MFRITNLPDGSISVNKIDGNWDVPADPTNTDYQQYLAWLAEGNEPVIVESEGA